MQVREMIMQGIDWPCEVHTLFRETNLGCKAAVAGAIDWFFSREPEGIILEDDCLPVPSFFRFCDELLERFREDATVMSIAGNRFFLGGWQGSGSYTFGRYPFIWGWASWARAWNGYDRDLQLPEEELDAVAALLGSTSATRSFWSHAFRQVREGSINTWDISWCFHLARRRGRSVYPRRNLVTNIGFGAGATHATGKFNILADLPCEEMPQQLDHRCDPQNGILLDRLHDRYIYARRPRALRMLFKLVAWILYRSRLGSILLGREEMPERPPLVELIPAIRRSRPHPGFAGNPPPPEDRHSSPVSSAEAEGSSPRSFRG